MVGGHLVAAAAGALLAASPVPAVPAPLIGQPASKPPFVACPVAPLATPIPRPPRPVPPSRDPNRPMIGGEGLDTQGLTVPVGAPPPLGFRLFQ